LRLDRGEIGLSGEVALCGLAEGFSQAFGLFRGKMTLVPKRAGDPERIEEDGGYIVNMRRTRRKVQLGIETRGRGPRSDGLAMSMSIVVAGAAVLLLLLTANVLGAAAGFIIATTTIVFLAAALFFLVAAVIFVHSIAPAMLC